MVESRVLIALLGGVGLLCHHLFRHNHINDSEETGQFFIVGSYNSVHAQHMVAILFFREVLPQCLALGLALCPVSHS